MSPSGQLVSTPGGGAGFWCTVYPGVVDVQWLVNGTLLDDPSLVDATVRYLGSGFEVLTFANLSSGLNMTRIGCRAVYSDGRAECSIDFTLLLLQG